eukprot:TRINITY_DN15496_c0_g1_i1.p1 TRINITY_DN15496_c0_g1~~TRINITY_DN15496_c0_g1_i1.p1  ORF type:complete len:619 (-),score=106.30 TRINITY_DN15496_c0_g1_i1:228-2084(-)
MSLGLSSDGANAVILPPESFKGVKASFTLTLQPFPSTVTPTYKLSYLHRSWKKLNLTIQFKLGKHRSSGAYGAVYDSDSPNAKFCVKVIDDIREWLMWFDPDVGSRCFPLLALGTVTIPDGRLFYALLMQRADTTAEKFFANKRRREKRFWGPRLVKDLLEALVYMRSKGKANLDIKADNVFKIGDKFRIADGSKAISPATGQQLDWDATCTVRLIATLLVGDADAKKTTLSKVLPARVAEALVGVRNCATTITDALATIEKSFTDEREEPSLMSYSDLWKCAIRNARRRELSVVSGNQIKFFAGAPDPESESESESEAEADVDSDVEVEAESEFGSESGSESESESKSKSEAEAEAEADDDDNEPDTDDDGEVEDEDEFHGSDTDTVRVEAPPQRQRLRLVQERENRPPFVPVKDRPLRNTKQRQEAANKVVAIDNLSDSSQDFVGRIHHHLRDSNKTIVCKSVARMLFSTVQAFSTKKVQRNEQIDDHRRMTKFSIPSFFRTDAADQEAMLGPDFETARQKFSEKSAGVLPEPIRAQMVGAYRIPPSDLVEELFRIMFVICFSKFEEKDSGDLLRAPVDNFDVTVSKEDSKIGKNTSTRLFKLSRPLVDLLIFLKR